MMRRFLMAAMVLMLLIGAAGESLSTEYLISMAPEEVLQLEQRLEALGYLTAQPDQSYDADTRQALESFQQANGLTVTGQPDAPTTAKLYDETVISRQDYLKRFAQSYRDATPLRSGDINNQVQTMQRLLQSYGYFSGSTDGVFGEATLRAVERFQMVNGLPVTGEADGMTLTITTSEPVPALMNYLGDPYGCIIDVDASDFETGIKEKYEEYFTPAQEPQEPKNTPQFSKQPGHSGTNPESDEDKLVKQLSAQW